MFDSEVFQVEGGSHDTAESYEGVHQRPAYIGQSKHWYIGINDITFSIQVLFKAHIQSIPNLFFGKKYSKFFKCIDILVLVTTS